jgi:Domain of unknown function (DUF4389)
MTTRAVRLVVRDPDLTRSRLSAGFRLVLAIPHLLWLLGWLSLATTVAFANWIALLISGKPSPMLHRFVAAYVRYATHVVSYVSLAADPYPGFGGRPGSYPVDVEIDDPQPQSRWITFFRLFLAIPAIALADAMLGLGTSFSGGWATQLGGVVAALSFLGYFVCIFRGRMPQGFRDLIAYCIGYSAQVSGFLFLLTDRYPNSDPSFYESANVYRSEPIGLTVDDDLRRSRLTTFFRLPLVVPHLVWLLLWGIVAFFAGIANWFATLFRGQSPVGLHRFLAAYLRYTTHVVAFVTVVGNPFPGFVGRVRTYPIDLEIARPERQRRLVTGFRWFLSLPANLIASGLGGLLVLTSIYSWFYALVRGRVPRGLRNLGAFAIRYNAQLYGYTFLLTEAYPYTGPTAGAQLTLDAAPPLLT